MPSGIDEDAGMVIGDILIQDFDNDRTPEILVIPVTKGYTEPGLPIYLKYDKTTGSYVDKSQESGFTKPFNSTDATVADFNNDGYLDIYVTTWKRVSDTKRLSTMGILYNNTGEDGKFVQVKQNAGILPNRTSNIPTKMQAVLTSNNQRVFNADYDLNGFPDILVSNLVNIDGENVITGDVKQVTPSYLFANKGNNNHWLQIDLQGTKSNRDALGAIVKLTTSDGMTQYRDLYAVINQGFGQNSSRLHFGLKDHKFAKRIEIIWPSGLKQVLTNVPSNQVIQVKESTDSSPSYQSIKVGNYKNQKLNGTPLDDTIIGQGGKDVISGLEGNDKLSGGDGNDTLNGGNKNDSLFGNYQKDLLRGDKGNDTLNGGNSNDTLEGGQGNDSLLGGIGADVLTSGSGKDRLVFYSPNDAKDTITDFTVSEDKIVVSQRVFSDTSKFAELLPLGTLPAENFVLGSSSTPISEGIFVYDHNTGNLFFDSYPDAFYASPGDPGGRIHLATLTSKPALSNRDIVLE